MDEPPQCHKRGKIRKSSRGNIGSLGAMRQQTIVVDEGNYARARCEEGEVISEWSGRYRVKSGQPAGNAPQCKVDGDPCGTCSLGDTVCAIRFGNSDNNGSTGDCGHCSVGSRKEGVLSYRCLPRDVYLSGPSSYDHATLRRTCGAACRRVGATAINPTASGSPCECGFP
jgi:hypothetical protein